jgi:hypothetical protein
MGDGRFRTSPRSIGVCAYAQAYVGLVKGSGIVAALMRQSEATARLLQRVDDGFASRASDEAGKWTVKRAPAPVILID